MNVFQEKQRDEFDLWKQWQNTGDNQALNGLVTSFTPIAEFSVNKYKNSNIPQAALRAEAKRLLMDGLKTYSPAMGTQLNTHLMNYQKGMYRYVTSYNNVMRIPEHRAQKIGTYIRAKDYLEEQLGRPPSALEVAEETHIPLNDVTKLERELVKDLVADQAESLSAMYSPLAANDQELADTLDFLYYELNPEEKLVYEYMYGQYGKPKIERTADIATKLKWPEYKVQNIKRAMANKLKVFL